MIKKILLLTTVLTSFNALAVETWQGYKPIEKVQAPFKSVAMASVLQIKTVTLLEKDANNYEVVNTDETKKVTDAQKLNSDSRVLQIETCRNQGLKRCPIFTTSYSGTGFINKGRDFYTCRHMVHNWVTIAAKENNMRVDEISPAFKILDYKKNVVYNSATTRNPFAFSAINSDTRLNFVLKEKFDAENNRLDLFYKLSEFVALTSPVDLVAPKNFSISSNLSANDQVYIFGYPGKTTLFGGTGDTAGNEMVASTGPVAIVSPEQEAFFIKALASGGMSGGMIAKASGDVVGMVCGSPARIDIADLKSQAVYLDVNGHEKLWQLIQQTPVN